MAGPGGGDLLGTGAGRPPARQDHHVVLLQKSESGRRLPIWIGHEHALELALRLLGRDSQLPRPIGSDLTARLVRALGGNVREVRIDRLTEGTYYAVIVVQGPRTSPKSTPAQATPSRSPWSRKPSARNHPSRLAPDPLRPRGWAT